MLSPYDTTEAEIAVMIPDRLLEHVQKMTRTCAHAYQRLLKANLRVPVDKGKVRPKIEMNKKRDAVTARLALMLDDSWFKELEWGNFKREVDDARRKPGNRSFISKAKYICTLFNKGVNLAIESGNVELVRTFAKDQLTWTRELYDALALLVNNRKDHYEAEKAKEALSLIHI